MEYTISVNDVLVTLASLAILGYFVRSVFSTRDVMRKRLGIVALEESMSDLKKEVQKSNSGIKAEITEALTRLHTRHDELYKLMVQIASNNKCSCQTKKNR